MSKAILKVLHDQVLNELTGNILPFWMTKAIDKESGGFVGQIDGHGNVVKGADKGGILNARILWTFSSVGRRLRRRKYITVAKKSWDYIENHFFDEEYGGTYWKLTYDGKPADTKKQIYAQAFFIYALSDYCFATGDRTALQKACSLFELVESKSFDSRQNGYFEAYDRRWKPLEDLRLSDKDENEKKTTNTHLHILEAYTNLYDVCRYIEHDAIRNSLINLVNLFLDKIIDPVSHHLNLFFDENWNSKSSLISYGHDIEASWLIYRAAEIIGDKKLIERAREQCILLGKAAIREGLYADGSLIYEKDLTKVMLDTDRHWWPQAEAVVGLFNLYQLTGDEHYLQKAVKCWDYITANLVDRKNGEWYWSIKDGKPNLAEDKAGFWKCPYHNARACLEISERISSL